MVWFHELARVEEHLVQGLLHAVHLGNDVVHLMGSSTIVLYVWVCLQLVHSTSTLSSPHLLRPVPILCPQEPITRLTRKELLSHVFGLSFEARLDADLTRFATFAFRNCCCLRCGGWCIVVVVYLLRCIVVLVVDLLLLLLLGWTLVWVERRPTSSSSASHVMYCCC